MPRAYIVIIGTMTFEDSLKVGDGCITIHHLWIHAQVTFAAVRVAEVAIATLRTDCSYFIILIKGKLYLIRIYSRLVADIRVSIIWIILEWILTTSKHALYRLILPLYVADGLNICIVRDVVRDALVLLLLISIGIRDSI